MSPGSGLVIFATLNYIAPVGKMASKAYYPTGRPDIMSMVDRALKANDLSIYLPTERTRHYNSMGVTALNKCTSSSLSSDAV